MSGDPKAGMGPRQPFQAPFPPSRANNYYTDPTQEVNAYASTDGSKQKRKNSRQVRRSS